MQEILQKSNYINFFINKLQDYLYKTRKSFINSSYVNSSVTKQNYSNIIINQLLLILLSNIILSDLNSKKIKIQKLNHIFKTRLTNYVTE